MLPLNSLFIFGLHIITDYEVDEQGNVSDKMALWWLRYKSVQTFGEWWSKPLILCPPCMASVWGTIFYFIFSLVFFGNVLIFVWPFYVISLSGLNYVVQRYIE